jgi:hypothetical protein
MKRILIQLDSDPLPSVFDRVVAVDSDVDELFSYAGVTPENVVPLVHGAIFTRGPADLKHTALFIGGSDVAKGEQLLKAVKKAFFGPMRVSVLCDPNGANTTAAAAVRAAAKHLDLSQTTALVLGGTGPVGQRAARILARQGTHVTLASRSLPRAQAACEQIQAAVPGAKLQPLAGEAEALPASLAGVQLLIAAGAAGVEFLKEAEWRQQPDLRVAIDLNAVPPVGLAGIEVSDKGKQRDDVLCYGAIGVGGTKMKVHKAAVRKLFTANDLLLDVDEVYALAIETDRA